MAKKLLGARSGDGYDYEAGIILSDEDAAKTGLPASDFADVQEEAPAPEPAPTPEVAPDAEAEIDAQAGEKNTDEQSADAEGDQGAAPAAEDPEVSA